MQISDQSPVFIFPFSLVLNSSQIENCLASVDQFLSQWQSHGSPMRSMAWFEESQFLVVSVDADLTVPSGCSKDKLYHFIKNLENELEISLESPIKFFVKKEGLILALSRAELKEFWISGQLNSDNQLFLVWIETYGQFATNWKSNLGQYASVLKLPLTAASIESNF